LLSVLYESSSDDVETLILRKLREGVKRPSGYPAETTDLIARSFFCPHDI